MLIDPLVGSAVLANGGHLERADVEWYAEWWARGQPNGADDGCDKGSAFFQTMAASAPARMHFHLPSYARRGACASVEDDPTVNVIGTSATGTCLFWLADAGKRASGGKDNSRAVPWECKNDGTCEQTTRGAFASEAACLDGCGGGRWKCVDEGVGYCLPSSEGSFANKSSCEGACGM